MYYRHLNSSISAGTYTDLSTHDHALPCTKYQHLPFSVRLTKGERFSVSGTWAWTD